MNAARRQPLRPAVCRVLDSKYQIMNTFIFANNVSTTLASSISSSATSFTLASSANLPSSIPAGQYLVITFNDVATKKNYEVVYVGAVSGATCSSVLRGQEGTAALAWLTGDFAYSAPTAGQQESFGQTAANNAWTGTNTFSNPVTAPLGTTSGELINLGQFPSSLGANGYKKYADPNSPSGYFIEQWGAGSIANGSLTANVVFPISFPNSIAGMWCGEAGAQGTWGTGNPTMYAPETPNTSGATVVGLIWNGSTWTTGITGGGSRGFFWRAIGY